MKILKSFIISMALVLSIACLAVVPAMSCPYSDDKPVEHSST